MQPITLGSANSHTFLPPTKTLTYSSNKPFQQQHLLSLLLSCNSLLQLKQIHAHLLKSSFHLHPSFLVHLIPLYASFHSLSYARRALESFPAKNDTFMWNTMIRAFSISHLTHPFALQAFSEMLTFCIPNEFTFPFLFKSCGTLQEGKQMHAHLLKSSHLVDNVFACAALLDLYIRCGRLDWEAVQVFDRMTHRDVVCWNRMISGYAKDGNWEMVLVLFKQMWEDCRVEPTSTTIVNVLSACGETGAITQGRWVHQFVRRRKNEMNIFVETALVTMYSRCGDISAARSVFGKSSKRDLVLWSAMIGGHGMNGQCLEALETFAQMRKEGLKPDGVTLVSLLSACSHAGLVEEGLELFHSMKKLHGLEPQMEHYACMVDLLGRSGQVDKAWSFIQAMPMAPGPSVWGALLGACRAYGDVKLGEQAAKELFKIEGENGGNCVLLCNIYMEADRVVDAMRLRKKMRKQKVKKTPGCSCVEVENRVNCFRVRGGTHPQTPKIFETLEALTLHAIDEGCEIQIGSSLFVD